jgi:hypothetical protein
LQNGSQRTTQNLKFALLWDIYVAYSGQLVGTNFKDKEIQEEEDRPESSVRNHHHTPRNITEELKSVYFSA